jgi:hypothetical protein
MAHQPRVKLTPSRLEDALRHGPQLLDTVDHRTGWMRRLKDLLNGHESDLACGASLSEGQRAIIRRCAMLQVQLEMLERKWAEDGGAAGSKDLETYQRCSNSLRRLLESLGLHQGRRAIDVTRREREDREAGLIA